LEEVVEKNDKKRFSFNEDRSMIRANQGHSVKVDLGYKKLTPPEILFHGTAKKNLASILGQGLHKSKRHHVHLSADIETASKVGGRHGKVVILLVKAQEMHQVGLRSYCSENGVWLTDSVSREYLEVLP